MRAAKSTGIAPKSHILCPTLRPIRNKPHSRLCRSARSEDSGFEPKDERLLKPSLEGANDQVVPPYSALEMIPSTTNADKLGDGRSSIKGSIFSCGVKTATFRFDLPSPEVAVRNLMEQAQFAHLCTIMSSRHHRRAGYPFGKVVEFITDGAGFPIFSISPLAMPSKNLQEDSRCSLVVQMPGWTGLTNALVTIFGDVYQLPDKMQAQASELFQLRHRKHEKVLTGNATYFRMNSISDIYFVGSFGTVEWINVADYIQAQPDDIVRLNPHNTLHELNKNFSDALCGIFLSADKKVDDVWIISIDALGVDIRVRTGADFIVTRLAFDSKVHNADEAVKAMEKLIEAYA